MMTKNWTVEQLPGVTKITVDADDLDETTATPLAGSTTTAETAPVRTPMEIMRTKYEAARQITRSRVHDRPSAAPTRQNHHHVYHRLSHKAMPNGRIGLFWGCDCGDIEIFEMGPADDMRRLYGNIQRWMKMNRIAFLQAVLSVLWYCRNVEIIEEMQHA